MPSLQYNVSMIADGFLSKYCIFQNGVDDMYRKVFDSVRTGLLRVHNYITTHVISCDHVCFTCDHVCFTCDHVCFTCGMC